MAQGHVCATLDSSWASHQLLILRVWSVPRHQTPALLSAR